jgi:hypothetical protein
LYKRLGTVMATDFWKRLPDERKIVAVKKWREQIDKSRPYRLARMETR